MQKELQNRLNFLYYSRLFKNHKKNHLMKSITLIIASFLLLTSCALGSQAPSSGTGSDSTYTPAKPTLSLQQSSPTTVTN